MITWQQRTQATLEALLLHLVTILVKSLNLQCLDIYIVESCLHRSVEDSILRICQVGSITCWATRCHIVRDSSYVTLCINHVRTDEELLTWLVDHTVGWSTTDTLLAHDLLQVWCNLIEFVVRTIRLMWRVGNHPQAISPRHYGSCTALALRVVVCQMGVDTAITWISSLVYGCDFLCLRT